MWFPFAAHMTFNLPLATPRVPPPVLPWVCWPYPVTDSPATTTTKSSLSMVLCMGESPALWVLGFIKNNHGHPVDSRGHRKGTPLHVGRVHSYLFGEQSRSTKWLCLSKEHTSVLDHHNMRTSIRKGLPLGYLFIFSRGPLLKKVELSHNVQDWRCWSQKKLCPSLAMWPWITNYSAIWGIAFFISKARIPLSTPPTMVPPLTHVPWIQANSQAIDLRHSRSCSESGGRIKKYRTTRVWITFASTALWEILSMGNRLEKAVNGEPHSHGVYAATVKLPVTYA